MSVVVCFSVPFFVFLSQGGKYALSLQSKYTEDGDSYRIQIPQFPGEEGQAEKNKTELLKWSSKKTLHTIAGRLSVLNC